MQTVNDSVRLSTIEKYLDAAAVHEALLSVVPVPFDPGKLAANVSLLARAE